MANEWFYGGEVFHSEDSANAAVLNLKNRLDNNPTDWVRVKPVTGDAINGWVMGGDSDLMTDDQINNISGDGMYSLSAVVTADNFLGISATEVTQRVGEMRALYAQWKLADHMQRNFEVTDPDMSAYMPSDSSN